MGYKICILACSFLLQKFYTDWCNGVSGVVRGATEVPKNNFAMKLVTFVEAQAASGYFADVKRELDHKIK